jgi:magnesium chelatase family protein
MWLEIPAVDHRSLVMGDRITHETRDARKKIERARMLQQKRYAETSKNSSTLNAHLSSRNIKKHIILSEDVQDRIAQAAERMALSPRAVHRVIKLARTIADLDAIEEITEHHILEALQYRSTL